MTREEFDAYCASLKATTHVVQWGGASVWKVGGKIFAICSNWGPDEKEVEGTEGEARLSFKCSDLSYQILCELEGVVPAPYLARAKWVLVKADSALSDEDVRSYISDAHAIVGAKLTKKLQRELGLLEN
jgi:predicted DNA-binding protein (MmcQ/YjbR family)